MQTKKIQVLLVEDSVDDYEITHEWLIGVEENNYVLRWVDTYEDGIRNLETDDVDACLVDYSLNAKTGIELIKEASRLPLRPPMILLTGNSDPQIDMKAMKVGAADYLNKQDLTPALLDRSIRYAIEHHRAKQHVETINRELNEEIARREELQSNLIKASRQAGMAEVATGVLHNVGNVLNSVNVSTSLLMQRLKASRVASLTKAAEIICQHQSDLETFLTADDQGRHFPRLLEELAVNLSNERDTQLEELRSLIENIEHVNEVINMQQMYAHAGGTAESVNLVELVEDALKINNAGLMRHGDDVVRDFGEVPPIVTDRHKVLQILINLISNAKYAFDGCDRYNKTMILVVSGNDEHVLIQVRDNGVGIPHENLTKIFSHGFTTRKDGHGFGLHSSALAAQELCGSVSVHSDGIGHGAVFTLRLPL